MNQVKIFSIFLIFTVYIFRFVNCAFHPDVDPSSFCYDNPECDAKTWGGTCKTGKHQSPINIDTIQAQSNYNYQKFNMNNHYLNETLHSFYAQNNGHTAQFELSSNTSALSSELKICSGHLADSYNFAQFHFHWAEKNDVGSEHTINGRKYPLELHLVHYKSNYSSLANALATNDASALAVFAVLFDIGDHNEHLAPIIDSLKILYDPGNVTEFNYELKISDFFPSESKDFARYFGSLTTPTCDEKVVWTIFLETLSISEEQMSKFRELTNKEGNSDFNFRPTQPLNDRKVQLYHAEEMENVKSNPY